MGYPYICLKLMKWLHSATLSAHVDTDNNLAPAELSIQTVVLQKKIIFILNCPTFQSIKI